MGYVGWNGLWLDYGKAGFRSYYRGAVPHPPVLASDPSGGGPTSPGTPDGRAPASTSTVSIGC
jgi:hypothetical protein